MLQLSVSFTSRAVLSLRTGTQIGVTLAPIINPNNLKIEGFYCQIPHNKKELILLSQDIREIIPQGFVVNDQDAFSLPEELVRLQRVLDHHFEILGKQVITASGEKMGKVGDYAADTQSMFIHKLYVNRSLLKHFASGSLGIDRTQIIDITDKAIIVNDLQQKVPAHANAIA